MRFSTISAVLCGLAIVPGVVSQSSPSDRFKGDVVDTATDAPARTTVMEPPTGGPDITNTLVPGTSLLGGSFSSPTGESNIQITSERKDLQTSESKVPQIAGGVVGGVLGLALIGGLIFFLKRRKRNRKKPSAHHESAVIADKSRASSPVSHTSPIYGGAGAAAVPPLAAPTRQPTDPEFANPPPSQQPVVPIAPVHTPPQQQATYLPGSPAELQSREVDGDGVSVNSFDMQRPVDEPTVPRLPVNQPTGSGL